MAPGGHPRPGVVRRLAVLTTVALLAAASLGLLVGLDAADAERRDGAELWQASHRGQRPMAVHPHPAGRSSSSSAAARGDSGRWERILTRLDRMRARAFARGDVSTLAAVYQSGSAVLHRDRAVLRGYLSRGLTVHGVGFDLLDVRIRRPGPGVAVLRVVDQLRPATARGGGGARLPLPRDGPTVHRLTLTRDDGGWRIAAVEALSG